MSHEWHKAEVSKEAEALIWFMNDLWLMKELNSEKEVEK